MRSPKLLLAALCFFLLSASAVRAQAQGNLIGQIRLINGNLPPDRILVTLQTRGATINSTYTDNEGRFGFFNLLANPYHVVIEVDEYQPFHQVVNVDPTISLTTQIHVVLSPRDFSKITAPPGSVSGGNPNLVSSADYTKKFARQVIKEFEAGVKADAANQADKAISHYRKAVRLAPDFYPAHNNLGVRYLSKSSFAEAESEFREVLRLNKDDPQAYFNLGNVLYVTKRYADARQVLEEGLSKSPNSAFGNYLLGSVQFRLGNTDSAEHLLKTAEQFDPRMPQVLIELASLYLQSGRKDQGISQLEEFLRRFPKDPLVPKVKDSLKKLEARSL